jgi:NodT family efflux transporter outer membrane factor (OMF) lipoprotein
MRSLRRLLVLAPALLAGACTVGPDFAPPEVRAPSTYAGPGDAPLPTGQQLVDRPGDPQWWKQFHNPALDGLAESALAANPTLDAAEARLRQAEEDAEAARAALLPQLSLAGAVGVQNYSVSQRTPLNLTLPPFEYYAAGPALSFPLDLFGGGRRAAERAAAYAEYRKHAQDAASLSLLANLADEAIRNAATRAQIADLEAVIADDERNVGLVQTALDAGSATRTQLLSVQSQLASDRTLLPDLRQQEAMSRHALAILAGKAPGDWTAPQFALDDFALPGDFPAGLPSALAHRRPDILAAEAQLHMASAAVGMATADLYPQVNLSAALVLETLTPASLAHGVINSWNAAAGLTQPLFDGGKLDARRRSAIDAYQAALAEYKTVVLGAFRDVADCLQALANDAERVGAETEAARSAAQALDLARRSFEAGNSGVLDVIDAERRSAEAQLGLSRARAQRLLDSVRLYAALGGAPLPAKAATSDMPAPPCCDF